MALFGERGYAAVTVAEIADRAGLTKRTFFNHFADKREVLFAGAGAFQASVVEHLRDADHELEPIDTAVDALTGAGLELAQYGEFALARRELIVSSPELQERELIKMASLASAITEGLRERHVPARSAALTGGLLAAASAAALTALAAVAVFTTAYDDWIDDNTASFESLMQRSLADLRQAIGCTNGQGSATPALRSHKGDA